MSDRLQTLQQWLATELATNDFELVPASEDASFRRYFRATVAEQAYIVMDAPPEHEDCRPFIDITHRLTDCHVNVPHIYSQDIEQGFLLLADLGDQLYLPNLSLADADQLYKQALDSLVRIQVNADSTSLPAYDKALLQREMDLFQDWLLTQYLDIELDEADLDQLQQVHAILIDNARQQPQVFVHRDYHSRNLMLTARDNPGIIDYQDAVYGPITYDLVSLLKDSYIYWPAAQRNEWIDYYLGQLKQHDQKMQFDRRQFQRWFDLMGVQRELKVGGIFARLWLRDNKQGFLKDIPRTLAYIVELREDYPELVWLIDLIEERVLPALEQKS